MIKEKSFIKKYCVWNTSGLTSKGVKMDDIKDLPTNMVIHHSGSFQGTNVYIPVPNMTKPFMSNLSLERKLIYNHTKISDKPLTEDYKHVRLLSTKVNTALNKFKSDNSTVVKYVDNTNGLTVKTNHHLVINYNPLYINRVTGINKAVTLTNFVLAEMVGNIINMHNDELLHFIPIKLSSASYERSDFIKLYKEMNRVSILYPEHIDYLLLAHFYSWLNIDSRVGILNLLPEDITDKIYLALTRGKDTIVYNLKILRQMREKNKHLLMKVINQLSSIGETATLDVDFEMADDGLLKVEKDNVIAGTKPIPVDPEIHKTYQKEIVSGIDNSAFELIDNMSELTPKQKVRLRQKATKYKNIEIDKVPVSEILKPVDINIDDSELDFIQGVHPDMKKSTIMEFDQQYVSKDMERDIVQSLAAFNKVGMFLQKVEKTKVIDKLNRFYNYKVQFEDIDGKSHTIHFQLPIVDEDGRCFVNGNYKSLIKQRVNLPIVKVSDTRVTLNSNYNKMIVQTRNRPRTTLKSQFGKMLSDYNYHATFDDTDISKRIVARDYGELATKYGTVTGPAGVMLEFNWHHRLDKAPKDTVQLEEKHDAIYFGKQGNESFFIKLDGAVLIIRGTEIAETNMIDLINKYFNVNLTATSDYASVNMLNQHLPVIFLLGYRYGLSHILHYMEVDYKLIDKAAKVEGISSSDMVIQFKDKKLVIGRTPEIVRLMFAGLDTMRLKTVYFEDMNTKDGYFNILENLKLSLNYIKGIDGFFDLFIDPITKDVLFNMGEPTNFKDILIRAVQLLSTPYHKSASAANNFRFRSYERYPGMIYNTLARAFHKYKYRKTVGEKFTISRFDIKSKIMKDPLLNNTTSINPIKDLKDKTNFNYIGDGGREKSTFMIKDRVFPKDNLGIVSEASSESMDTGINCYSSVNPNVINRRGMTSSDKFDTESSAKNLSVSSNVLAGITYDDGKRANMASVQMGSYVCTKEGYPCRVRTGFERVVAHRTSSEFAISANESGKIVDIDDKNHLIKVKYTKTKEIEVYEYGEKIANNTANGFFSTHNLILNPKFKKGSVFKKGDLLIYNKDAFHLDPISGEALWKAGINANVAFVESIDTIDDSTGITMELANKLEFKPTMMTEIIIDRTSNIHKVAQIGEHIKSVDPIIIFDQSDIASDISGDDIELKSALETFGRTAPKAKHSGVVSNVEIIHRCEIKDMSSSLAKFVRSINKIEEEKYKFATGSAQEDKYTKPGPITSTTKLGTIDLDNDIVVIRFYITENSEMGVGSKLVVSPSLKAVCARIIPPTMAADGVTKIDILSSPRGVGARIVNSPLLNGAMGRVLIDLEKQVIESSSQKSAVAHVLKVVTALDPSGNNTKRYKAFFNKMGATKFKDYIAKLKSNETQVYVEFPNLESDMKMENVYKAADITKTELFQRIWLTDPVTNEKYPSPEKYLIGNISIRRMQQTIFKKLAVSEGDSKTDTLTRQVMGDDRSSGFSNPEIQMMHAKGLDTTLTEFMKIRGGDPVAYSEFKRQLEEGGSASISQIVKNPSHAAVVRLIDNIFRGMNLDSNFMG